MVRRRKRKWRRKTGEVPRLEGAYTRSTHCGGSKNIIVGRRTETMRKRGQGPRLEKGWAAGELG